MENCINAQYVLEGAFELYAESGSIDIDDIVYRIILIGLFCLPVKAKQMGGIFKQFSSL